METGKLVQELKDAATIEHYANGENPKSALFFRAAEALASLTRELEEAREALTPIARIIATYRTLAIKDLEDDYLSLAWSDREEDKADDDALAAVSALYARLSSARAAEDTK